MLFREYSLHQMRARPMRTALTVLSTAIGVAAIVAAAMTTAAATRGVEGLMRTLLGRADIEVRSDTGKRFAADLADRIAACPGVAAASPLLTSPIVMFVRQRRVKAVLIGVDPSRDSTIRDYVFRAGAWPADGQDGVVLPTTLADQCGVAVGDEIRVLGRGGMFTLPVTGLLESSTDSWPAMDVVVAPLDLAQAMLRSRGLISAIDIRCFAGSRLDTVMQDVARMLPAGMALNGIADRMRASSAPLLPFRVSLWGAALLTAMMSAGILLNAFLMNVSERMKQFGLLRLVGLKRGEMVRLIVTEGACYGVVGSLVGIPCGIVLAVCLLPEIEETFQTSMPPILAAASAAAYGLIAGTLIASASAVGPASRASRVAPLELLHGSAADRESGVAGRASGWIGPMAMALVSAPAVVAIAVPEGNHVIIWACTAAAVALWVAAALRSDGVCLAMAMLAERFGLVELSLGQGMLVRRPVRTALTTLVITLAVSTAIGMGNLVLNVSEDIRHYMERAIPADFLVRVADPSLATGEAADLPEDFLPAVRTLPGVATVETLNLTNVRVNGMSAVLLTRGLNCEGPLPFMLREGDPTSICRDMKSGGAVIGVALSKRLGRGVGERIAIESPEGRREFRIVGLADEYLAAGLVVALDADVARQTIDIDGVDAALVTADRGRGERVGEPLRRLAEEHGLMLQSNADFRDDSERRIRSVQSSLMALLLIGLTTAGSGMMNCIAMNVLEQTREFGLLRAIGFTRRQIGISILSQALVFALAAAAVGLPLGIAFYSAADAVLEAATGQQVTSRIHPQLTLAVPLSALILAVAAAMVPARRVASLRPVEALRYE